MADLIAAVSTAPARSAIGVIRISGDGAVEAAQRIFSPLSGSSLAAAQSGKTVLGTLFDRDGKPIDKCICIVGRAPRTYTGEDTAEFHCHGSAMVLSETLSALFAVGARPAEAGEFTKRAFLNGKLDLTEAEAVIDIIDAETPSALRNAAGQLGGAMARKADAIYSALLDISSHFHAVIDWPDEDIGEFMLENYDATLADAERELSRLLATAKRGSVIKNGVKCAIIGKPNVGKSSLLNALAGYQRAIVTDIAGTTRDTLEERVTVGGVLLRLTDTAGLRETDDTVEKFGVERAKSAAGEADLLLVLTDSSADTLTEDDETALTLARESGKPWILVRTKKDLTTGSGLTVAADPSKCVTLSSVTGDGIDTLEAAVAELFPSGEAPDGEILTNTRQSGEVSRALDAVRAARASLTAGVTPDAVLTEIEDALSAIASITGREIRGDIISRIFERFCVGK